jgi:hypothetical protein
MTHQQYIDSLKSTILELGKKTVLNWIFSKFTLLAWGPLGLLVGMVVEKVLTIFINESETAIFFQYIDMRTDLQGKDFSEKAIANFNAQRMGTNEEKKIAEANLINSFRAFASFNN